MMKESDRFIISRLISSWKMIIFRYVSRSFAALQIFLHVLVVLNGSL